jgi:hypothetical protein
VTLYNLANVKRMLGETGTTNDGKIQTYGTMADNFILSDTIKVRNLPNPPTTVGGVITQAQLDEIKNHATLITVAYFYKFESGDTITSEAAELAWKNFFNALFRRPSFRAAT